ncbi:MAG: helix-turn-helix domain-containing protein [Gammaproteobacteria bacterium]
MVEVTHDTGVYRACILLSTQFACLVSSSRTSIGVERASIILPYLLLHIEEAYRQIGSHIDEDDDHDRDGRNVVARSGTIDSLLTPREKDVMTWIARGKGSWETGTILEIAERTVKFHLQNVYRKLGVVNRAQAVAKTVTHGLL